MNSVEAVAESSRVEFLYPVSRQYPFDEVCSKIVHELEMRAWRVPGLTVEFRGYGRYRLVSSITGPSFRLGFCRVQRAIPGGQWNDTAGVSEIIIPKMQLNVYEDESGPTLYLYVGSDWERDRARFMNSVKVNSKLLGEPRMYLQYHGECHCGGDEGNRTYGAHDLLGTLTGRGRGAGSLQHMRHTHTGRRSPLLAHTNDLGREYDPRRGEPRLFETAKVMEQFRRYLEDVVLKGLTSGVATES